MKILGQILSLILCFQLIVGCNSAAQKGGDMIAPRAPSSSETVELSGSIASAIHRLGDMLWPRAIAAEGTLHIYDVSSPTAPVELHSQTISGESVFRIKLSRAEVRAKLIKAVFVSSEGDAKSRETLFDIQGTEARMDASMDIRTSLRSKIFEAQLIAEDVADARSRFREIKADSIEEELALLGSGDILEELMLDPALTKSVAELVAKRRIAAQSGDSEASEELHRQLFSLAVESGVVTDQAVLSCGASGGSFYFKDRSFQVYVKPIEKEVYEKFPGTTELGVVTSPEEATKILKSLTTTMAELSKNFEKNLSVRIYFKELERSNKPVQTCRLFGQEQSEAELELADKEYFDRDILNSLGLDEVKTIDDALVRLAELYLKSLEQLDANTADMYLDPLVVEHAQKSVGRLFEARFVEFFNQLNPSKFASVSEFDLSHFDAVDFQLLASVREGSALLNVAHEETEASMKEALAAQEMAPEEFEARFAEQLQLAKYLRKIKQIELELSLRRN
jgi:hypothetical protein